MSSNAPLTGTCGCGAVRFQVSGPFIGASYCHCTRCQRRTGAGGSANARVHADDFEVVSGEDRIRSWAPPDGAEKFFCGDCGSALFSRNPAVPDVIGARLGAFDSDPVVRPSVHQFVAYAAAWETISDDGLPRHPERAPG